MISRSDLEELDKSFGTPMENSAASGRDAPNGNNLIGAINNLQRELDMVHEMGLTYSDLPNDKQAEIDNYTEDLRFHIKKLANVFPGLVGSDTSLEVADGTSVDLPGTATSASSTTADLPADPRGEN